MKRDYRIKTHGEESANFGKHVKIVKLSVDNWAVFVSLSKTGTHGSGYFPSGPIHGSLDEARLFLGATLRGAHGEGSGSAQRRFSSNALAASKETGDL